MQVEGEEYILTALYKGINSPEYQKYRRNWAHCYRKKIKIEENYISSLKRNKNVESVREKRLSLFISQSQTFCQIVCVISFNSHIFQDKRKEHLLTGCTNKILNSPFSFIGTWVYKTAGLLEFSSIIFISLSLHDTSVINWLCSPQEVTQPSQSIFWVKVA